MGREKEEEGGREKEGPPRVGSHLPPPVFEILQNTLSVEKINNLRYPRKFVAGSINSSSISSVSGHQCMLTGRRRH